MRAMRLEPKQGYSMRMSISPADDQERGSPTTLADEFIFKRFER
jgi:hypothetical protein